jgi:hypothetical protein
MAWHLSLDFINMPFASWPKEMQVSKRKLKISLVFFIEPGLWVNNGFPGKEWVALLYQIKNKKSK